MKLKRSTTVWFSRILVPVFLLLASPARAADASASVSGAIFRAADQSPLAGARLHAGDPRTDRLFSSAPSGRDGGFTLAKLPPSTYRLAVEADGGLYVVPTPVVLEPGSARRLNLAVTPAMAAAEGSGEGGSSSDSGGGGFAFLKHPAGATLLSLGLATIIGVALQDDNPPRRVSPSAPQGQ